MKPISKKRILLDTRSLAGKSTGVGRYVTNLIREIINIEPPDLSFSALCLPEDNLPKGIERHVLKGMLSRVGPMNPLQRVICPQLIRYNEYDLYHYLYFDVPRVFSRPIVATCYDIEPLRHPELFSVKIYWYYKIFARILRHVDLVIVISENTRRDLIDLIGISPERIRVIHLGVDSSFYPVNNSLIMGKMRNEYLIPDRYILYLGNTMPHKNLLRLIAAMELVHQHEPNVSLLLAGRKDKYRPIIEKAIEKAKLGSVVRFLGFIKEEHLPILISGAQVFVYPSLYEGFGLPVLEAMACGTPVVASNISPIKEIVEDGGVLIDPENIKDIAEGILGLLRNPSLAKHIADMGQKRSRQFSWRRCAEQHIDIYREVLMRRT